MLGTRRSRISRPKTFNVGGGYNNDKSSLTSSQQKQQEATKSTSQKKPMLYKHFGKWHGKGGRGIIQLNLTASTSIESCDNDSYCSEEVQRQQEESCHLIYSNNSKSLLMRQAATKMRQRRGISVSVIAKQPEGGEEAVEIVHCDDGSLEQGDDDVDADDDETTATTTTGDAASISSNKYSKANNGAAAVRLPPAVLKYMRKCDKKKESWHSSGNDEGGKTAAAIATDGTGVSAAADTESEARVDNSVATSSNEVKIKTISSSVATSNKLNNGKDEVVTKQVFPKKQHISAITAVPSPQSVSETNGDGITPATKEAIPPKASNLVLQRSKSQTRFRRPSRRRSTDIRNHHQPGIDNIIEAAAAGEDSSSTNNEIVSVSRRQHQLSRAAAKAEQQHIANNSSSNNDNSSSNSRELLSTRQRKLQKVKAQKQHEKKNVEMKLRQERQREAEAEEARALVRMRKEENARKLKILLKQQVQRRQLREQMQHLEGGCEDEQVEDNKRGSASNTEGGAIFSDDAVAAANTTNVTDNDQQDLVTMETSNNSKDGTSKTCTDFIEHLLVEQANNDDGNVSCDDPSSKEPERENLPGLTEDACDERMKNEISPSMPTATSNAPGKAEKREFIGGSGLPKPVLRRFPTPRVTKATTDGISISLQCSTSMFDAVEEDEHLSLTKNNDHNYKHYNLDILGSKFENDIQAALAPTHSSRHEQASHDTRCRETEEREEMKVIESEGLKYSNKHGYLDDYYNTEIGAKFENDIQAALSLLRNCSIGRGNIISRKEKEEVQRATSSTEAKFVAGSGGTGSRGATSDDERRDGCSDPICRASDDDESESTLSNEIILIESPTPNEIDF